MITSLPPQSARPTKPSRPVADPQVAKSSTMASDYRLLGLRPREARIEVIREAVHQAASQVQVDEAARNLGSFDKNGSEVAADDNEQRLTQIAVAGYRLLDPRRRRTLFERVQLLMWTEEELDASCKSMWTHRPVTPKVTIALKPNHRNPAATPVSAVDENKVALELFRSIRQHDRRATAIWIGLAGLTISLTITLALFAYFA